MFNTISCFYGTQCEVSLMAGWQKDCKGKIVCAGHEGPKENDQKALQFYLLSLFFSSMQICHKTV